MKINRFFSSYDSWFSVNEIYTSKILKACLAATLFVYFLTFKEWIGEFKFTVEAAEQGRHLCWPYFKNCGQYYFLSTLPYGYSAGLWYMTLFCIIGASAWFMLNKQWRWAHLLMWPLFLWKVLGVLVLSMAQIGNYEYYHLVFSLILLALPHKIFFLKFTIVWFYFLSTAAKIHPTWTLGTYFSSLKTGLPLFPNTTIPLWTNLVILLEMVGAWFLLGPKSQLQRLIFALFVVFHLYSGLLVSYRYPATVLPMLFILFGPWYQSTRIPTGLKTIPGWLIMGLLGLGQSVSHLIPGDEKMTMEGNFYGLYMFEANHQCRQQATFYRQGQPPNTQTTKSFRARNRCDVYREWFKRKQQCQKDPLINRIQLQFDHSINGGPFYRIVDTPNICALNYQAFGQNHWIKTPAQGAPKIGYPMRNYYY